jgi:dihydrofolate reductase
MSQPRITLIAAMDRNRAIGRDNALPWHLPDELKLFKAHTLGKPILMGRRTAESLGRALPGRANLVLTRSSQLEIPGMHAVGDLDAALARCDDADELMVIGGGEVYAITLPLAQRLLLTEVDTVVEGADTWFPAFDRAEWMEAGRQHHPADARHAFGYEVVDLLRHNPDRESAG